MSSPDLFVVCKSCGSEVSPYVTECPYCGTRLRKRAPKIEREGGVPKPPKPPRGRRLGRSPRTTTPRLSRLRPGEIPGIRGERSGRPYATMLLVALSFGIFLSLAFVVDDDLALTALSGHPWRFVTAPFLNANGWQQFASLIGLGVFGWLLERRNGPLVVIAIFALAGVGAVAAAVAIQPDTAAFGTQGAALGLLCAWAVPALLARRRDGDDDADMLGVAVLAVVLLLIPVAVGASVLVSVLGAVIGAACGLLLAAARRR
jgi:membrane associated rhomboid family serine protease